MLDYQFLDFNDSPSKQLYSESRISAPMSKESLTNVATEALRELETGDLIAIEIPPAERSAMIINRNLEEHAGTTLEGLAPAIVFEPTIPVNRKHMLGSDAVQSPSKRLRGRPMKTAVVDGLVAPSNSTLPTNGRLKRPTRVPKQRGNRVVQSRAAEEVFDLPEDSPSTTKRPSLIVQREDTVAQGGREENSGGPSISRIGGITTDPKRAEIAVPFVPRKRGRPRKRSMKSPLPQEISVQDHTLVACDYTTQSGSPPQTPDMSEKLSNSIVKENDLSIKLDGQGHRKEPRLTEKPPCLGNTVLIELSTTHKPPGFDMVPPAGTPRMSKEAGSRLDVEAEEPRTEEQREESSDGDPNFIDDGSDDIEDDADDISEQIELQENIINIANGGERSNDQGYGTIASQRDREIGHRYFKPPEASV